MDLHGKVAAVTGGTRGLGRGITQVLTGSGAKVVTMARDAVVGAQVEKEVRSAGGELRFLQGDIGKRADGERLINGALDEFGRIDILINNAAISLPALATHEYADDEWDAIIRTNLSGTFNTCRAALPHMREQRDGVILNVASLGAVEALENLSAYNASKAAVVQLSKTIAVENVRNNVRANAIIMGAVETDLAFSTLGAFAKTVRGEDYEVSEEWSKEIAQSPMMMPPEEVGRALAVLCTPDAKAITGAVIAIDRGFSAGLLASGAMYAGAAGLIPF